MSTLETGFAELVAPWRAAIDAELDRYTSSWLDDRVTEVAGDGTNVPRQLREAMRYSLLAPGKRLRPLLVLMAADACGGDWRAALPAACAVEMIHAYSLIHDDLPAMDDDELRRGRPTCHVRFDEATAILAGDALIPLAFELLASEIADARVALACCRALAQAAGCRALVGGQMDDLTANGQPRDVETLEHIHRRKTGALLRVSLRLGALVADATEEQAAALDAYAAALGLAFQITDDLLDHCGTAEQLGKNTHKDMARGKLTFPSLLGVDASRERANALVQEACAALAPFEERGDMLRRLAWFVGTRNH